MKKKNTARAALAAAGMLAMTSAVWGFSEPEKKEIGEVVRQYLLEHPEILIEMSQKLERKQREEKAAKASEALKAHGKALFSGEGDLVIGNPNGKVAMVEFFDYNCGFCKRSLPDVIKLKDSNSDLKIIIKEFPILGPASMDAAKYAMAARKQGMDKYWKLHSALLAHKGQVDGKVALALAKRAGLDVEKLKKDADSPEIGEIISRNMAMADALGVTGTPAFIIDEHIIPGALGYRTLNKIIDQVRKTGCKHC